MGVWGGSKVGDQTAPSVRRSELPGPSARPPTVRARIVSTSARLRTLSAISPASCWICSGDAGMESSNTRVATISMRYQGQPSPMGTQARA